MEVKGTTYAGTYYLNNLLSSSFVTTGETHTCQGSGESKHALWAADDSSESWESLHKEESSTAEYPGDWSPDSDSSTKLTSVTDIDGNSYSTVVIGTQNWMAENLKVTKYRNGDNITNITTNSDWASNTSGAYGVYDNDETNSDSYGLLYNWYAVDNSSGRYICPEGWHVPTRTEFNVLYDYLNVIDSTNIVGQLKETGTDHWNSPNTGATNDSGFTALPAGYRSTIGGSYSGLSILAYFWSSTANSSSADFSELRSNDTLYRRTLSKAYGFSIRCLKDY
jgi:uncharacterized protein (TIGR02145 family)